MITRDQWLLLGALAAVMIVDAAISIDGAWNHNATFYEANPILSQFKDPLSFAIAIVICKAIALLLVLLLVRELNREPGPHWGTAAAAMGTLSFSALIGTMVIINLVIAASL